MSPDRPGSFVRRYNWELGWGLWAIGNLAWMELTQDWISIPFHFIWVSFTLLYGFRAWSNRLTWVLAGAVVVSTGLFLTDAWTDGTMSTDEMFEVPLMFGMFLAMMLHTTRRRAAIAQLEKVSEQNVQLLERQRLFVQNASHALRSPITVALAHAEMLHLNAADPTTRDDADIVVDEINRLRKLSDRLLLLVTAGAPTPMHLQPTELGPVIDEIMRRWRPVPRRWLLGRRDDATVLADGERLTLALDTLIENAVKMTREGGVIELVVRREQHDVLIEVRDDGPGIPPEMLDSIFERFTRVDDGNGSAGGFGLGLSIVRAVAEMHGGAVSARNGERGGAIFELRLVSSELERQDNAMAVAHSAAR